MPCRLVACSLLAALALVPSACGGGDESTSTEASTSSTTSTPVSSDQAAGEPQVYFGFIKATATSDGAPGALVRALDENSPVATAGLTRGDVIVAVDGEPTADVDAVAQAFEGVSFGKAGGDKVEVKVVRGSRERTLTVVLAANVYLGAEIRKATKGTSGVLVVSVARKGPADDAGVEAGDVITAADGTPVASVGDLFEVLGTHVAEDEVELAISRGSKELSLTATVTDRTANG